MLSGIIRFGPFELDLDFRELRRNGGKIRLQDQPFRLLALLAQRPGQLVTREELRQALWPADTFVDFDRSLNTAIKKIRHALDDSPQEPAYIETLPRQGYRFLARVETGREPSAAAAPRRHPYHWFGPTKATEKGARRPIRVWLRGVAGLLAILTVLIGLAVRRSLDQVAIRDQVGQISSLAVLPFVNLGGASTQEYLADGLTDELINDLGKLGALRVISRTSVMPYKETRKSLSQIAHELNVNAVIEGSVMRSGERVRVKAELVRIDPETHLWANSYERAARDSLALQEEIALDIAHELRVKMTPRERATLASYRAFSPDAQDAYLRGVYLCNKRTERDLEKSINFFEFAVQKDPRYAPAYAALGIAYEMLAHYGHVAPRAVCPKAYDAAEKALSLDPTLAEAHAALALYNMDFQLELKVADAEFRRAIELNPGYAFAHVWRGELLSAMGRHTEAVAELDRAYELDPTSLTVSDQRALVLYMARRYDEAIAQIRKTLELEPRYAHAHCWLGKAYLQKGLLTQGMAELEQAIKLPGGGSPLFMPWLGYAYALSGKRVEAHRVIQEMKKKEMKSFASPYGIAAVYCGLGEKNLALAWFEKAYQERDPLWATARQEPAFDPLRSEQKFRDLFRRAMLPL